MDQNIGLEAKIYRKQTKTTLTMDLWKFPPQLDRFFLSDQTSQKRTNMRIMEDHMINAQINRGDGNRARN